MRKQDVRINWEGEREVRMEKGRAKEGEQDEERRWQDKLVRGREVRTEKVRAKEGEQDE
jgi:hypothetical protein